MQISGFIKNSFVDYPGNIACVVFTPGCNFNCWYCHNYDLINETVGAINEEEVFNFLLDRKGFIDGVVVTGGEPTMQPDLEEFIKKVKQLGFKVKLDTNGTNLNAIKNLVQKNLLDYIAMDIKAPINKYNIITTVPNINEVVSSINYIKSCGVNYEFRTTYAPNLNAADIEEIVNYLGEVNCYALQQYKKPEHIVNEVLPNHTPIELTDLKQKLCKKVKNFIVRNI